MAELPMRAHSYQPLDSGRREIRIINVISPVLSWKATHIPLECTTLKVSLDASPQFVALSYVWGSMSRKVPLILDGMLTHVTESLDLALRNVFKPMEVQQGLLWADALCINQNDDEEKSWQVQLMSKIYSAASSVLAWLGEASNDSESAVDFLRTYGSHLESTEASGHGCPMGGAAVLMQAPDGPVHNFIQRTWFQRLWICQEIVLAKQISLVCGSSVLDGDHFMAALEGLGRSDMVLTRSMFWNGPRDIQTVPTLERLESIQSQVITAPAFAVFGMRKLHLMGRQRNLAGLLHNRQITEMQATDERDYIYALLGIAADTETLGLSPDYTKTWQQTFRDVTVTFLRRDPINGLAKILLRCSHVTTTDLPSWVPDWTAGPVGTLPLIGNYGLLQEDDDQAPSPCPRLFEASGRKKQKLSFSDVTPSVLGLKGVYFDSISGVGPTAEESGASVSWDTFLKTWFSAFFTLLGQSCARYQERRSLVICRTALTDMLFKTNSSGSPSRMDPLSYETHVQFFDHFWEAVQGGDHDCVNCTQFGIDISVRAHRRRAFCTSRGFLGLGHHSMRSGDMVLIILGIQFPMIFRKSSNSCFRVVGDAYVHGIMDGEFMAGGIEVETFLVE